MRLEAEVSKESLPPRRYCDQAATSWPKPPEVVAAWQAAAVELGVARGEAAIARQWKERLSLSELVGRGPNCLAMLILSGLPCRRPPRSG